MNEPILGSSRKLEVSNPILYPKLPPEDLCYGEICIPHDYNKLEPPNTEGEPLDVKISVDGVRALDFDDKKFTISFSMFLSEPVLIVQACRDTLDQALFVWWYHVVGPGFVLFRSRWSAGARWDVGWHYFSYYVISGGHWVGQSLSFKKWRSTDTSQNSSHVFRTGFKSFI